MRRSPALLQILLAALLICLATGCGARSADIGVQVRNEADAPVALWMTKEGTPVERNWLSPGQIVMFYSPDDITAMREPALVLPPGETGTIGPRRGKFATGAEPVLYVYPADTTVQQKAATDRRSGLMDQISLGAGTNFIIVRAARPLLAERVSEAAFNGAAFNGDADEF